MMQCEKEGLRFFQFPGFLDHSLFWHGIFTRKGGESKVPYDSFNFGSEEENSLGGKKENQNRLLSVLGGGKLCFIRQCHGDRVFYWENDRGDRISQSYADAMITKLPGHWLVIPVADCQAVMLVDDKKKVVANIHSGWRGSIKNIIARTVLSMVDRYGCCAGDIKAAISPSLGPCCGEFINYKKEIPRLFWKYRVSDTHFDFWRISISQLIASGIDEDRIFESRICTRCNPHLFYSYRHRKKTGRFAVVIGIKEQ